MTIQSTSRLSRAVILVLGGVLAWLAFAVLGGRSPDPTADPGAAAVPAPVPAMAPAPAASGEEATDRVAAGRPDDGPRTEAEHYEALMALAEQSADQLIDRVETILSEPGSTAAKRAALRAWRDSGVGDPLEPFIDTLRDADAELELRRFALAHLVGRSADRSEARDLLTGFLRTAPAEPRLRGDALAAVLQYGKTGEVHACVEFVYAERDQDVIEKVGWALRDSRAPGSRATLIDLSRRHPDAAVRRRLRELAAGQ